jgi:hypothetical protein
LGRRYQEARLRLPAFASICVIVGADADFIKGELRLQRSIDFVNLSGADLSSGNIGLVGNHYEKKTFRLQLGTRLFHAGK